VQKKVKIRDPKIFVGTIHSVKGAEADNVVVLLDVTRSVMLNIDKHPDTENRVFYVAFTRAKKNLILVNSNSKYSYKL
jgi:superfamily I DNA/RNA helicase